MDFRGLCPLFDPGHLCALSNHTYTHASHTHIAALTHRSTHTHAALACTLQHSHTHAALTCMNSSRHVLLFLSCVWSVIEPCGMDGWMIKAAAWMMEMDKWTKDGWMDKWTNGWTDG